MQEKRDQKATENTNVDWQTLRSLRHMQDEETCIEVLDQIEASSGEADVEKLSQLPHMQEEPGAEENTGADMKALQSLPHMKEEG